VADGKRARFRSEAATAFSYVQAWQLIALSIAIMAVELVPAQSVMIPKYFTWTVGESSERLLLS
jgi:hypothetical protein